MWVNAVAEIRHVVFRMIFAIPRGRAAADAKIRFLHAGGMRTMPDADVHHVGLSVFLAVRSCLGPLGTKVCVYSAGLV